MTGDACLLLSGTATCALLVHVRGRAWVVARVRAAGACLLLEYRVARYARGVRRLNAKRLRARALIADMRRLQARLDAQHRDWFGGV
ncbi:hypothetical protein HLH33_13020 [Gluconacetobacter diazotrophicus]|uniref:Transposase n=1 Tax=Gluconacetobacter diazotrophicus TaxID=33996 RepID=A0A7W4I6N2_GLUDI|nr:hypothetical protein [Gluconacetobacter diazotrophicus]MBB2157221.1 hypothetical protein [Gluconacetobacter diazotrophicus]